MDTMDEVIPPPRIIHKFFSGSFCAFSVKSPGGGYYYARQNRGIKSTSMENNSSLPITMNSESNTFTGYAKWA